MNKKIRTFVLKTPLLRELFFFFGRRKTPLKKIDKGIEQLFAGKIRLDENTAKNVIVSLTSYGARLTELKYTLYSLITQTVHPEKIIVNIAFDDEPRITPELRQFEKYGVEFYLTEDLRSYKKLVPTAIRFPEKAIVTCDDDIFFQKNWLQILLSESESYPGEIISHLTYKNERIMFFL